MKRMLTMGIAAALAALMVPAAATARHSSHHTAHHASARHHRRHHSVAHTVVFSPASVKPSTTAPAPGEPPVGEGEAAGTIASFEGGVLKITMADGTTVSGKVTEKTEIQCACPDHEGAGGDDGEDSGVGGEDSHGGFSSSGDGFSGGGDVHGSSEDGSTPSGTTGTEETPPSCGPSSLVAGAKVKEAELSVSSAGAVWEKVELAHS
ncbi:MAG TPA: hypothetical protein VN618_13340 [Solirubrobacteraceae bacterium]|nr:hypothetical protein [Solirubrobacteraceae bacterium]